MPKFTKKRQSSKTADFQTHREKGFMFAAVGLIPCLKRFVSCPEASALLSAVSRAVARSCACYADLSFVVPSSQL